MQAPQHRIVLFSCLMMLFVPCGCKLKHWEHIQAPWEHLKPEYSDKNAPHSYVFRSIFPLLRAITASPDGNHLWAVGESGTILKSEDQGDHWTAVASGTTKTFYSIAVTGDGQRLWALGDGDTIFTSQEARYNRTLTLFAIGNRDDALKEAQTYLDSDNKSIWSLYLRQLIEKQSK